MTIKSYFASSVQEAMQKARLELGPEALLLNSQDTAKAEANNRYEVTFGVASTSAVQANENAVAEELRDLRRHIEQMQRLLSFQSQLSPDSKSDAGHWFERLVGAGFSLPLAHDLAQAAQLRVSTPPPRRGRKRKAPAKTMELRAIDPSEDALLDEVESRFSIAPGLDTAGERKIVILVGPPGAGKTTTLVKLAVIYGTSRRVPMQIVSTDTLRLGGAEQLQAYSRILGASFQAVGGRQKLIDTLESHREKKLILIDSPGYSPADLQEADEVASVLERYGAVEVQLVLPATLQPSAMMSAYERLRLLRPSKLIFTHLDETDAPGSLLDGAIQTSLPISFLTNGQQIPEDLLEASKSELRQRLTKRLTGALAAAA
jgi:flagellar biosynthesis protein FlhF